MKKPRKPTAFQILNNYRTKGVMEIRNYITKLLHPERRHLCTYAKKDIATASWTLNDLYQKTKAAQDLGYHMVLIADDEGLKVWYEKNDPTRPSWL